MNTQSFNKTFFKLVIPIAFQQLMLSLVSVSDALMLGRIEQNAMSAVSLAAQVQFILSLFLAAITIGCSMFSAQYWGKGDKNTVEQIMGSFMQSSIIISLAFTILTFICPKVFMQILTNEPILITYGTDYLRAASLSYLLCGISQVYLCIMKNTGHAAKCSMISSVAVVTNILLNALLIFGFGFIPAMGICGAAYATVIARTIELLWAIIHSLKNDRVRLKTHHLLHKNKVLEKNMWKYTLPVLGNELVWGCGFAMTSVIMGHLGEDAVAANAIASMAKNLIICFCLGIANGASIIIGNTLGAGKLEEAREYGKKLCHWSIISGVIAGILILVCTPIFCKVSNLSNIAENYLTGMLFISSYYMIGKSVNSTVVAGIFPSGGDSRFGLFCDIITLWCIVVPLGLFSAFAANAPVLIVYFVVSLDEIIKVPAVYRHYKKYLWIKDLTQEGNES